MRAYLCAPAPSSRRCHRLAVNSSCPSSSCRKHAGRADPICCHVVSKNVKTKKKEKRRAHLCPLVLSFRPCHGRSCSCSCCCCRPCCRSCWRNCRSCSLVVVRVVLSLLFLLPCRCCSCCCVVDRSCRCSVVVVSIWSMVVLMCYEHRVLEVV